MTQLNETLIAPEHKFAVLRGVIDNKDTLIVQDVDIGRSSLAAAKREVEKTIRKTYNASGTLQWIGWVDGWQLASGPIQIK